MIRALAALEKHRFHFAPHPLLDPPTLNVGTIRGGIKTNVVPDYCEAEVDIRLVPGQMPERVTEEVREVINRDLGEEPFFSADKAPDNQAQIGIEVVCTAEPVQTSPSEQVVIQAQEVARDVFSGSAKLGGAPYFTDGSVIQPKSGKPMLIIGPGEESQAHHPNEYVYLENLAKAATFYEALALRLLC
jgi:succinyl-diaminopimelate desuccinylase